MKKIITLTALICTLSNNTMSGMLKYVKHLSPRQSTLIQKRNFQYQLGTVRITDYNPETFRNNVIEANEGATKTIARNDGLIRLLMDQTLVAKEIIKQHDTTLTALKHNTSKDYVDVPNTRPLYDLIDVLEKELTSKQ